jgi:hypothetical protein
MPLAMHQVMNEMRTSLLLLIMLLTVGSLVPPVAEAVSPAILQRFPSVGKSSIAPGEDTTFSWTLSKDIPEFLLYYDAGSAGSSDVIDVYINDAPVPRGQFLVGKGWIFCDGCQYSAGTYDVGVFAPPENVRPIEFYISIYNTPQPPVDFAGFIPAKSMQSYSEFGVLFPPSSTNYTIVLGAAPGAGYDFFINHTFQATVTGTTTLSLDLGGRFQMFTVDATGVGADVTWTVEIQGPPRLEVAIVIPQSHGCNVTLNPKSGESTCVVGAVATPTDDGSPRITYLWTANGGKLNSTTSQWVEWTAPAGVANFTLAVEASAPGYVSGSDNLKVQVVPEFPSFLMPLILMIVLGLVAIAQRRSRKLPA